MSPMATASPVASEAQKPPLGFLDSILAPSVFGGMTLVLLGTATTTVSGDTGGVVVLLGLLLLLIPTFTIVAWLCAFVPWSLAKMLCRRIVWVPRTLFFDAQFRITDLILLVALLGNVEGLLAPSLEYPVLGLPLCISAALWVAGGSAWGLWIATRRKETRILRRWWLMLLGILFPLAVIGFPIGVMLILSGIVLDLEDPLFVLSGLCILPTCGGLACSAILLHRQAAKRKIKGRHPHSGLRAEVSGSILPPRKFSAHHT